MCSSPRSSLGRSADARGNVSEGFFGKRNSRLSVSERRCANKRTLAGCIATSPNDTKNATRCLSKFDMKTGAQIEQLTCVARANDEAAITLCLIKDTAGDGAKVAACAAGDKV